LPPVEKKDRVINRNNFLKKYDTKFYTKEEQDNFEKKSYGIKDPLKSKDSKISLQKHQTKFIRKFILSNVQGSIVFHGVGSGKTMTALVASHYYLLLHPDHKVIIVSPPALIYNFVKEMISYGLDIRDNRYSYYTYEKFIRNCKDINEKTMLIIDEAHNFRTYINITITEQINENGEKVKTEVLTSGKRSYYILEACKQCDKAILLTGTPFINKLYDIENLLCMVTKKNPVNINDFSEIVNNKENRNDYFKYKISYYQKEENSEFYPKVNTKYIPIVMNDDEQKRYNAVENTKKANSNSGKDILKYFPDSENVNSFYNGVRQFSDIIEDKKIKFMIDTIKKNGGQSIIYTTFINNSLNNILRNLEKYDIKYGVISGKENQTKKEKARTDYNNETIQVLCITKAGTEGVDTKRTRNMFIVEGSLWNENLVNQAIARAVRYKSHYDLPKKEQYVNVYRLIVCKKMMLKR
jgi:superfamily II DNA or RNA helicase